jgi:putative SOS response-associated peptidase YedK
MDSSLGWVIQCGQDQGLREEVALLCYHTSLARSADYLEKRFQARFEAGSLFEPIYHSSAFSGPRHPVISNESTQSIQFFQWGLVPFWTKDEIAAERIRTRTINARAETIHQKPSFRASIMTKRCLVLVDGFYEWRQEGNKKYPHYISLVSNDAFALAGIWDKWLNTSTGVTKDTFSIITTKANPLLERIHNTRKRMPVMLRQSDERKWLEKDLERDAIDAFLKPYDASQMQAHTVSRLISTKRVNTNIPEVMREFTYEGLDS